MGVELEEEGREAALTRLVPAQEETKQEDDDKGEDEDGENELAFTIRPKRASSSRSTTTTKKQQQQGQR